MCFSCKGLRRCEVYEQNSEASIWRRFVYSLWVSSSFCLCGYVCMCCALWDKISFAAYRPRFADVCIRLIFFLCLSFLFLSRWGFVACLGLSATFAASLVHTYAQQNRVDGVLCVSFVYAFLLSVLSSQFAMCVFGSRYNAHIIVIIYLALLIVRTEISLLRVYVCARGCSRLLFSSQFFILIWLGLLFSILFLFLFFFLYCILFACPWIFIWDPCKAIHIATVYIDTFEEVSSMNDHTSLHMWMYAWLWITALRYHFYKMWCKRDMNKSYK